MIGSLLQSRYRLDAELGQGGMGIVYRAHDTLLDRAVAVKLLTDSGLGTEGRARLLREARAAARLNHPNIVGVYDAGETAPDRSGGAGGQPFIVMELVEGESLYAKWPIPLENVVDLAKQICAALDHAHTHGVVHRDLKLENILLTPTGVIKLTDFGLARSVASRMTSEGLLLGTVFYLAPELALGQPFDGRADLYALGVLLYELVTGKLPFTADEPLAVVSQHLYAPVVPPRAHNDAIPDALNQLIVSLMSKRPEDRPASAREVLSALVGLHDQVTGRQGEADLDSITLLPIPLVMPGLNILDRIVRGRLVGREREMAEASAFWKQALNGQSHVLLLSGEPGIGKSRLVRELVALAEVSRALVLKAECYAEGGAPYAPIAQMIRTLLQNPAWAGIEALDLPNYVLADLVTLSPDLRAQYPHVLPNPSIDPQSEQHRLFESVVAAMTALAARAPVLLVLEDVHWADSGTLFLLRHLARRTPAQRLLIMLTYREVEIDETCCLPDVLHDLNRERLATRIKLTRLTREQTQKLLEVMFGEDISPELLEGLYRETEGNPFFLEEVCKALLEDGQIYFAEGRWQRPAVSELRIPQSVRVTIQSRLGKLPTPAQEALRLAAVLGREFDFDILHSASGLSEDVLIEAMESATRAQIIEEARANGHGLTFAFAHSLIPSTLRESMSGPRLRVLHRRAAAAVEQLRPNDFEALAYHAGQAGDDQRASYFYHQAGDRALARYANQEAERHYRIALDLGGADEARAQISAGLGEALFRLSRYAEAEQAWREAITLHQRFSNYNEAARLYGRAVRAVWYQDDAPRSLVLAREGLTAVAGQPETPGLAALLHEVGRACFFNELMDEARDLCQRALALAERFGLTEVQAESLTTIGLLPNQTTDEARAAFERAIELAEAAQLLATAARAHFNIAGNVFEHGGDARRARAHFERARAHAQRMGMAAWEQDYLSQIITLSLNLGEIERVEADLATLRELQKIASPQPWAVSLAQLNDGILAYYQGRLVEAVDLLQAGKAAVNARGLERKFIHEFNGALIQIFIYEKKFAEAEQLVQESLELARSGVEANHIFFNAMLCILLAGQGRLAEAHAALEIARRPPETKKHRRDSPFFLQLMQCWPEAYLAWAEKRWPEALAALEATSAILQQMHWRWHTARVYLDWADVYLERGEPGDHNHAIAKLNVALAEFQAMHISYYAALARDRLNTISSAIENPATISGD